MSLGWGLRGYIGGGFLGAMIPGTMIALVLCLLLGREEDAGYIAAFGAIGIGFGGQETYGQTVGLSFLPETYAWAILGFAIKGAVWGLLGGAVMAIAFSARRDISVAMGLMVAATWTGWKLLNEPKLIYFSNRLDRPRAELWFGLFLGALALLAWLSRTGVGRLPLRFALWGGLGGGIGFASGAALQVWGRGVDPHFAVGWWKMMEFTFGACLGAAFAFCAWRHRDELAPRPSNFTFPPSWIESAAAALAAIAFTIVLPPLIPSRLPQTIAGACLLALLPYWRKLSWHAAITATYCAFAIDLQRNRPEYAATGMWIFIVVTTALVALLVARHARVQIMFLLLVVTSTGMALLKQFLPPWPERQQAATQLVFVALALLAAAAIRSMPKQRTA